MFSKNIKIKFQLELIPQLVAEGREVELNLILKLLKHAYPAGWDSLSKEIRLVMLCALRDAKEQPAIVESFLKFGVPLDGLVPVSGYEDVGEKKPILDFMQGNDEVQYSIMANGLSGSVERIC